ncbi:MAG: hypothetical protein ACR2I8_02390 [Steroidobacteraceae bacterium]
MPKAPPLQESRRRARIAGAAVLLLIALLGALVGVANASGVSEGSVYRCRGSSGQRIVSQSLPAECAGVDVDVIDASGRVVRVIPGAKSQEQLATEKAAEEQRLAAAQRDKTLLATYLTVADIERLRDQRIELLEQQNVVTRQYIANLRTREARLMQSAQRYRPYSTSPNAPNLPEPVASEIVNTVKGLQVYEEELKKNTAERARLTREFASDIQRFKELKGLN